MIRRGVPIPEIAAAIVVAALILLLSPGVAVAGLVAIGVLLICGLTLAVGRWRARRRGLDPRPRARRIEDQPRVDGDSAAAAAERSRSAADRARAAAERQRQRAMRDVSGRRR